MEIVLYRYLGERNRLDKSDYLTELGRLNGDIKAETSLLSPSLLVSLPIQGIMVVTDENDEEIADIGVGDASPVFDFNYFYIPEFRRYYYLSSYILGPNRLATISGIVDPLYSFKDEIEGNSGLCERNEFEYDEFLEDSLIPLSLERDVDISAIDEGSMVNTRFAFDENDHHIAVTTGSDAGMGIAIYPPEENLPEVNTQYNIDAGGSVVWAIDSNNSSILMQELIGDLSSLSTFFKSLIAFPYDVSLDRSVSQGELPITIYKKNSSDEFEPHEFSARGIFIPSSSSYRIAGDFILPSLDSFLDYPPFSHYEIYIPFHGYHEISMNNDIAGDRVILYYGVNYQDGSAEAVLYDVDKGRTLFTSSVQMGIRLAITSSNAEEQEKQRAAMQNNLILSLIGSGIGMVASAASKNVLGVVGSGLNAVNSLNSYNNQMSLMFAQINSSPSGNTGALYLPLKPYMKVTHAKILDDFDLAKFAHEYGRPLMQVRKPSNLLGYTKFASFHLSSCSALDVEKSEIVSSFLGGVYL